MLSAVNLSHSRLTAVSKSHLLGQVIRGRDERPLLLLEMGGGAPLCGSVDAADSGDATHGILAVIHHHPVLPSGLAGINHSEKSLSFE